jgi:hypothetical protein
MPIDEKYARRLNIVIGEQLLQWVTARAESQGQSVSALIREALEKERLRTLEEQIRDAAEDLSDLYRDDAELRAFESLDGENFK